MPKEASARSAAAQAVTTTSVAQNAVATGIFHAVAVVATTNVAVATSVVQAVVAIAQAMEVLPVAITEKTINNKEIISSL